MQKNHDAIKTIQRTLNTHGVEGYLIQNPVDIAYLLGISLSTGSLILTSEEAVLFVDSRYFEAVKTCGISVVLDTQNACETYLKKLSSLGFDSNFTSYKTYETWKHSTHLVPLSSLVSPLRAVKTKEEITLLHQAALYCEEGFQYACSFVREGMTEEALARAVTVFWLQQGLDRLSFQPIVAFGHHSGFPHHNPSRTPLRKGDVILLDMGVVYEGYHSDLTRVYHFGTPSLAVQESYHVVYLALHQAIARCHAGITGDTLDKATKELIEQHGLPPYQHGLGHGVGLEIHEDPVLSVRRKQLLEKNMVVTIEPGIYKADFGIRLEQMVCIEEDSSWVLSNPIPEEIPCIA